MKPEYVNPHMRDGKKWVYAICKCPLPSEYVLKMPKIEGKNKYSFHCDICGTSGVVYTEQEGDTE